MDTINIKRVMNQIIIKIQLEIALVIIKEEHQLKKYHLNLIISISIIIQIII